MLQFLPTKDFLQWPTQEIWKWFINVFWLAWWSPGLNKGQCNYVHDTSSPRYTKNARKKGSSPRLLLLQYLRYLYLSPFLRLLRRLLLSSSDRRSHTGGVACVQAPAGRTWLESPVPGCWRWEGRVPQMHRHAIKGGTVAWRYGHWDKPIWFLSHSSLNGYVTFFFTAVEITHPSEVSEPPSLGCWEALSNGQSLYKYLKIRKAK